MLSSRLVLVGLLLGISSPLTCLKNQEAGAEMGPEPSLQPTVEPYAPPNAGRDVVPDVAERVVRGVVNISSTKVVRTPQMTTPFDSDPFFRHFFGPRMNPQYPRERRERSLGSGVIVSRDGVVLTNNHVVSNAEDVRVAIDELGEFDAKILGTDPDTDLAVLELDAPKDVLAQLEPLEWGESATLRLGETVLAVGNPFGVGQTVTMGIVSATGRDNVGIVDYENFIQTDAAINPGNSGGALVNLRGELIGINTAIISRTGGYQGIGFAIPSDMARPIMESLLEHGRVVRGFLGVGIQNIDRTLAEAMKLDRAEGVVITDILDGPAQDADLERGDVILKVDDEDAESVTQVRNYIAAQGPGKKIELEVKRGRKTKTVTVELAELPDEQQLAHADEASGVLQGLTVSALTPDMRKRFQLRDGLSGGVVIVEVERGSHADYAGLEPGDVILEVNRAAVRLPADVIREYRRSREHVLLLIERDGRTAFRVLQKQSS